MFLRVLLVVAVLHGVLMVQMTSKSFFQVKNVFFGNPSTKFCLIGSEMKRTRVKSGCASRCSVIPRCSLTCFNESTCLYYDSLVSKYWNPSGYPSVDVKILAGLSCFSSYYLHGDITDKVINLRGNENPPYLMKYAIDGYNCPTIGSLYGSGKHENPWMELEFDSDYPIREVIVFTRINTVYSTAFAAVEVRVGSVSGVEGNFSAQTFFDYYHGMADSGEVVSFRSDVPIKGKFLSVKIVGSSKELIIKELKVLT